MASQQQVPQHGEAQVVDYATQEKGATVAARTAPGSDSSDSHSMKEQHEWKPGWMTQFPYTGFGALLGVVICSAAAVGVVYASNGKAKSEWKLKAAPNVLLSIFNSLSGILVTMAVGQGIAISWWRRAMKGTTVENLHHSWSFSSSIAAIVKQYKFFNIIALTALCTKFAIIDGTLFQKALTTYTALGPPKANQLWTMPTTTFPVTGRLNGAGNATSELTFAMSYDLTYWLSSYYGIQGSVVSGFSECDGLCGLSYQGVGFASSCDYTNVSDVSRSQGAVKNGDNEMFNIAFTQMWPSTEKNYSYIEMNWLSWSSYSLSEDSNPNCNGQLYNLTCELRPAIIEYPITVQNSSFSARKSKSKYSNYLIYPGLLNSTGGYYEGNYALDDIKTSQQLPGYNVTSYIDVPESQTPSGNTSIGGLVFALQTWFDSHATVSYDTETTVSATGQNSTSTKYVLQATGLQEAYVQDDATTDGCPSGYGSPFDQDAEDSVTLTYSGMLNQVNLLSILVSSDVQLRPNYTGELNAWDDYYYNYLDEVAMLVNMTILKDETYYASKYGFAWGAFASTIVVVALIVPSFWGYWELGRKVTLGPLEIANAFEAPAFSHLNVGAGGTEGVLKAVGKEKVQYGARHESERGVRYGFLHHRE